MKLWDKGAATDQRILDFTVGDDHLLDLKLLKYDCLASIAHAKMLTKIGVLTELEKTDLTRTLNEISALAECGNFPIDKAQEDGHTAIENYLTEKLGETGKKIHTARSRNDQVLTALRLFYKDELTAAISAVKQLSRALKALHQASGDIPLPGFTHTRKAMPSSVGMWAGAFIDAMRDNRKLLKLSYKLVDQSPLGTGAGYGIPLDIDREMTARELAFQSVQENPIYAQNSRGKFEGTILHAATQVMIDLNKLACDLIFLSLPEFGCFRLPPELCTGSSIMPQKKNPDVLELVRSHYHTVQALEFEVKSRAANLISGYHRDMQLSKGPVMRGLQIMCDCLEMARLVIEYLDIDEEKCRIAMTEELFATARAYELVKKGVSFREAYLQIGREYQK